jgi:DNA-binding helix-hairpin-helix protein with protein kinase domain
VEILVGASQGRRWRRRNKVRSVQLLVEEEEEEKKKKKLRC